MTKISWAGFLFLGTLICASCGKKSDSSSAEGTISLDASSTYSFRPSTVTSAEYCKENASGSVIQSGPAIQIAEAQQSTQYWHRVLELVYLGSSTPALNQATTLTCTQIEGEVNCASGDGSVLLSFGYWTNDNESTIGLPPAPNLPATSSATITILDYGGQNGGTMSVKFAIIFVDGTALSGTVSASEPPASAASSCIPL